VDLVPVESLAVVVAPIVDRVVNQLQSLVPTADIQHIGATAIEGALTKGDIDFTVRVAAERFSPAVKAVGELFEVKQPENWTAEFASFGNDHAYALPIGIQVVVVDSDCDIFVFLRDYLRENASALAEYNKLKREHALQDSESYWRAKHEFFTKLLGSRVRWG
jgi:GrpB-like predicted nucleotidyltransferase (UPF0157 family)